MKYLIWLRKRNFLTHKLIFDALLFIVNHDNEEVQTVIVVKSVILPGIQNCLFLLSEKNIFLFNTE